MPDIDYKPNRHPFTDNFKVGEYIGSPNSYLTIIEKTSGWLKCKLTDGREVWIAIRHVYPNNERSYCTIAAAIYNYNRKLVAAND
jgi:hypothetical protein